MGPEPVRRSVFVSSMGVNDESGVVLDGLASFVCV